MVKELVDKGKILIVQHKWATVAIAAFVLLVLLVSAGDKVSSWIESYRQNKFSAQEKRYLEDLEKLKIERAYWEELATEAQAREQVYATQVAAIREELQKGRLDIRALERQFSLIDSKYLEDKEFIDKAKQGLISKYELCTKQCADSAKLGYPCENNFCEQFK